MGEKEDLSIEDLFAPDILEDEAGFAAEEILEALCLDVWDLPIGVAGYRDSGNIFSELSICVCEAVRRYVRRNSHCA